MPKPEDVAFPRRRERFEDRRSERQQRKLLDEFFDHATLLAISRLINRRLFDSIDFPIATGKEGGVFRASTSDAYRAVKVYRIGNSIFRRLPPYAVEALRKETSVHDFAGLVCAWTRREHTILRRLHRSGVRSPEPIGYLRNVLVMEFIGQNGTPAPRLKDAVVSDPDALYRDLALQLNRMVSDAHLVHGDLSPYNVLLSDELPVLIDVAQAIPYDHPQARALLERDSGHFAQFLRRLGVDVSKTAFFEAAGGSQLPRSGAS